MALESQQILPKNEMQRNRKTNEIKVDQFVALSNSSFFNQKAIFTVSSKHRTYHWLDQ